VKTTTKRTRIEYADGLDGEGGGPLMSLKDTTKQTRIDDADGLDDQGDDKPLNEKKFKIYPKPTKDTAAVKTSTPTPASHRLDTYTECTSSRRTSTSS
jgi:hypothetical protein